MQPPICGRCLVVKSKSGAKRNEIRRALRDRDRLTDLDDDTDHSDNPGIIDLRNYVMSVIRRDDEGTVYR